MESELQYAPVDGSTHTPTSNADCCASAEPPGTASTPSCQALGLEVTLQIAPLVVSGAPSREINGAGGSNSLRSAKQSLASDQERQIPGFHWPGNIRQLLALPDAEPYVKKPGVAGIREQRRSCPRAEARRIGAYFLARRPQRLRRLRARKTALYGLA
jgi:hypothetical protein